MHCDHYSEIDQGFDERLGKRVALGKLCLLNFSIWTSPDWVLKLL